MSTEENDKAIESDIEEESEESEDEQESEEQEDVPDTITKHVEAYIKIDNEINKKKKELSELRKKVEDHKASIVEYFENHEISILDAPSGKLYKKESHSKTPIKPEYIEEAINKNIETLKKVKVDETNKVTDEIIKDIDDLRPIKTSVQISRKGK